MNLAAIYTKKPVIFLLLILIIVGFFIFFFNLNNQLFWDDEEWIINNNFVHDVSWSNVKFWFSNNTLAGIGLKSNYYRPFLFFTFALNYMISGVQPLAYHLTSNFIHIFNGVLVFWLIRQVFRRNLLAFLISILFLVHPLQTEAITYISGRGDSLVAMFILLSLILFHQTETNKENWWSIKKILSIVFLILGLFSRETGIIFPVLALVFYISALSSVRFIESVKRGLIKTWPYFATVIIYGVLRLTILNFLNTLNFYLEPNVYSENLHVRLFTFLPILFSYVKLLFVPFGLHMERSAVVFTSLFQWPVWPIFMSLLGLIGWLALLYTRERRAINRNSKSEILNPKQILNSDFRVWLFGWGWFFVALGPVSGITPINALMYEHWLYLPMIGFWLIVSFYLVKMFDLLKSKKLIICHLLLSAFLIVYLSFFAYQSIQRNILWGNSAEFYKDILKYEPDSARINNNLGNVYFNQENKEQAELYYRRAVESGDAFAQPYFNLGSMLQSKGDIFGAIQLYEKALEINPNFYFSHQALAVIYAQQGRLSKAIENIEKLKALVPNNPRVYYNSALIYIALNNKEQAFKDLRTGLKYSDLDPQTGELMKKLIKELQK